MNNNTNLIILLLSIIIVILAIVSYLEFKKIKIEQDKLKELIVSHKEKIEYLLYINQQKLTKVPSQSKMYLEQPQQMEQMEQMEQMKQMEQPQQLQQMQQPQQPQQPQKSDISYTQEENIQLDDVEKENLHEPTYDEQIKEFEKNQNIEVGIIEDDGLDLINGEETIKLDEETVLEETILEETILEETILEETVLEVNNIDQLDIIIDNSSSSDEDIEEVLSIKKKELFEEYKKKSVKELKDILSNKNLQLFGNKTKLIERILNNLD